MKVRCFLLATAVTLAAVGAAPDPISHQPDSYRQQTFNESKTRINLNNKTYQNRSITRLFDTNYIEMPRNRQFKNVDKNSKILNQNIGVISADDFDMLCWLAAAEAENQPFEGKRAVVAVVLNRVDIGYPFEDTIEGVIYQENQFSCVSDGRFFKAYEYVSEEDKEAVTTELSERSDTEIIYFRTDRYSDYGTPAYQIGDHFFSTK